MSGRIIAVLVALPLMITHLPTNSANKSVMPACTRADVIIQILAKVCAGD